MAKKKAKAKAKAKEEVNELESFYDALDEEATAFVSTGIPEVDIPLGGGIPQGVMVEAYGPPACGKTSIGYALAASVQKRGGRVILYDVERSFNSDMALRCGIDVRHLAPDGERSFLKTSNPEIKTIEGLFKRIKKALYEHPEIELIIVDSVANLIAEAMTKDDANLNRAGMLKAKLLTDLIPALDMWLEDSGSKAIVYFVNHEKEDISFSGHGPAKTNTPGGKALKYTASVRLEFRQVKTEKVDVYDPVTDQKISRVERLYIRLQATKNRFAPPFRPATFIFHMGNGIDQVGSTLAHAYAQGNIEKKAGGNYTVFAEFSHTGEDLKIKKGENVTAYFEEHPEQFALLQAAVVSDLGVKGTPRVVGKSTEDGVMELGA